MSADVYWIAATCGLAGLIVGFLAAALATADERRRLHTVLRHVYLTLAADQTRLRWTRLLDQIKESFDE